MWKWEEEGWRERRDEIRRTVKALEFYEVKLEYLRVADVGCVEMDTLL